MTRKRQRYKVLLSEDDIAWLRETHPESTISGILALLLTKYREANTFTPKDYAELAMRNLMEGKDDDE